MERTSESGVTLNQPRCPFCHDEIAHGTPQLACNMCRAWHHQECWAECGQRCAACGSEATGFGDSDVRPPEPEEPDEEAVEAEPDHEQEFRFSCPDCASYLWAYTLHTGELVECPECGLESTVPEPKEDSVTVSGTWGIKLFGELIAFAVLGLLVASVLWLGGLVWDVVAGTDLSGYLFTYGFSSIYLLGSLISVLSADDRPHTPRRRIKVVGVLSIASVIAAWATGFYTWQIVALLPHWPLVALTFLVAPAPPPPPPPEPTPAPAAPLKGQA